MKTIIEEFEDEFEKIPLGMLKKFPHLIEAARLAGNDLETETNKQLKLQNKPIKSFIYSHITSLAKEVMACVGEDKKYKLHNSAQLNACCYYGNKERGEETRKALQALFIRHNIKLK